MTVVWIVLLIALLFVVCFTGWLLSNRTQPLHSPAQEKVLGQPVAGQQNPQGHIPKLIWTYWHSPELPLVVERCIENWRRHNPDYQIHVLHAQNMHEFLPVIPNGLDKVGIPKQTDWIRLALLNRYGGVWLDASIILTRPLDQLFLAQTVADFEFFGFYLDGFTSNSAFPVIESWFLVAPEGSAFIRDWLTLFQREAIDGRTDDYLEQLKADGVYAAYAQKIGDPAYHTIHVTAQHLLQKTSVSPAFSGAYHLKLLRAEDGPYAYHVQSRWKRRRIYARMLWNPQLEDCPPLIKLRGGERRKLEFYLRHRLYRASSLIGKELAENH